MSGEAAPDVLAAARALALDGRSGRLVADLSGRGIRTALLKGATFARLLYPNGRRAYSDLDLLVHPDDLDAAERVLREQGFTLLNDDVHGRDWRRRSFHVDLHRTVNGVGVDAVALWARVSADFEVFELAGVRVHALAPAARALTIVLHAAQHGVQVPKPLRDLERALEVVPDDVWADATLLAVDLRAGAAYRAGLELVPAGRELVARLAIPEAYSLEASVRAGTAPPSAVGLLQLAALPGWRARLRFARGRLLPPPAVLRAQSPLARRGAPGLTAAYAVRLAAMALRLRGAVRAVRRARRGRPGTAAGRHAAP